MLLERSTSKLSFVALVLAAAGGCAIEGGDDDGGAGSGGVAAGSAGAAGFSGAQANAGKSGGGPAGSGGSSAGTSQAGASGAAGATATGGTASGGGDDAAGGSSVGGTGAAGGVAGSGGAAAGAGATAGFTNAGGAGGAGGSAGAGMAGGGPSGGASGAAGTASAGTGSGGGNPGTCTASKAAGSKASGSGPHQVVVETNSDQGIREGTIFRPADLGGAEKYPIFVWGEGGCSLNGLSNAAAMGEIASHGYFVIADGTPNGSGNRPQNGNDIPGMGKPLLAYIDWAVAENEKPCSAYYQSLDTSKIASNGFSCGGLMSTGTSGDPRLTTWGHTSSGTFSVNDALYDAVHTPVLIVLGGPSDIAYENGRRDYDNIGKRGVPILYFSKDIGHGGDLFSGNGGDFTKINLAWLNWWLKGDESATGKGRLVGAGCTYCSDSSWETKSANVP